MKINANNIQRMLETYAKPAAPAEAAKGGPLPADEVAVSGKAADLLRARQSFDRLPDVREEKVAAMRERLKTGQGLPGAAAIADAILSGKTRDVADGAQGDGDALRFG